MTSPETGQTIEEAITAGHSRLIAAMDLAIRPVVVRDLSDIADRDKLLIAIGQRQVVDLLINTLDRKLKPDG